MHKQAMKALIRDFRRYSVPSRSTEKAIKAILEGIDSPRSLAVWIMYAHNEHQQLVDMEVDPNDYLDSNIGSRRFRDDYLATELLSKAEFLNLAIDRKEVALAKFNDAELRNRQTNSRLSCLSPQNSFSGENVWLLNAVTQKIGKILGDFNPVEWFESCSWGPGATFDIGGLDTSPTNKFQNESGITLDLYYLVKDLIPAFWPLWSERLGSERLFCITPGNKITTVPKNAKTDRVIAIEPGLNVFFQLGVGRMISRRLLRAEGIDLKDQSRNGRLSHFGSLTGKLATVDFSSASDMISIQCVKQILPPVWYSVLDSCRSKLGRVGGEWRHMEKFSSMGNGFTFPLQSLIFLAVALACCEYVGVTSEYVGVFGDDVIIPEEAYATFQRFCEYLGFSINTRKSFNSGCFRESCGSHYFRGLDVKPIYLKKGLSDAESVFRLANAVRRLAHRRSSYGCDARLRKAWLLLYGLVPKKLRFTISEGYGDGGFVDNFDSAAPPAYRPKKVGNWVEGFLVPAAFSRSVKRASEDLGLLLTRLFYPSLEIAERNCYPLRSAVNKYIARLFIHRWYDLGPWL